MDKKKEEKIEIENNIPKGKHKSTKDVDLKTEINEIHKDVSEGNNKKEVINKSFNKTNEDKESRSGSEEEILKQDNNYLDKVELST